MNPQIRELHYLPIWKYSAWRNQKYWQRASSSGLLKSSEMLTSVECNRTIQQTSSIETRIGMEMIPRDSSASIFTLSTPSANKIHLRSISRSLRSSWDDFQALWIRINSNKDLSSLSLFHSGVRISCMHVVLYVLCLNNVVLSVWSSWFAQPIFYLDGMRGVWMRW